MKIGNGQSIGYIKIYTDYQTKRQAMLLHEARCLAPQVQAGIDPAGLTGIGYLYSPLPGRKMVCSCALREDAPWTFGTAPNSSRFVFDGFSSLELDKPGARRWRIWREKALGLSGSPGGSAGVPCAGNA